MRIGPYEVLEEIGRGGMGVVYRARHARVDREVALKLLDDPCPSEEVRQRFVREARALADLSDHPGIVGVHHAGALPDGRLYFAMELCPGRSLADRVQEDGPLPLDEAVAIVAALARAVAHAHARDVIHRDIKPGNVLLEEGTGRPRLLDFGLVKPLVTVTRLTRSGQVLGTPVYMAPEQADAEEVGPATDIYALGATLHAALAGAPPFEPGPFHQVLRRVLWETPADLRAIRPEVPDALDRIRRQALAREPDDRYPSAGALADDLEAFAEGSRVAARPPRRRPRRTGPPWRLLATAVVAAVLLLAGGAWLLGSGPDEPPGAPDPSTVPRDPGEPAASSGTVREASGPLESRLDEVLADERQVGPELRHAVRALLPGPDDPRSPFPRAEVARRARLARVLRDERLPVRPPPGHDLLTRLAAEAGRSLDTEDAPARLAILAALGRDGEALRLWHAVADSASPAHRRVAARLLLLRDRPGEARDALGDLPRPGDELLRGIALLLVPEPEEAHRTLDSIHPRHPVALEAAPLLAVLEEMGLHLPEGRIDPPATVTDELESNLENRLARMALERTRSGREEAGLPVDLARVRARLLVADAKAPAAIRTLNRARPSFPGDPRPATERVALLHRLLVVHRETNPPAVDGPVLEAIGDAVGADLLSEERIREALDRLGEGPASAHPLVVAARARWAEPAGRPVRPALARGMDALAGGLSGELADRGLRLLTIHEGSSGGTGANDRLPGGLLLRLAELLGGPAHAVLAGSCLEGRLGGDLLLEPLSWAPSPDPEGDREVVERIDEAGAPLGLHPVIALACAKAFLWRTGPRTHPERLGRAELLLERALEAVGEGRSPELHLLRARAARLRGDGRTGREEVDRSLVALREHPILARPTRAFLAELASLHPDGEAGVEAVAGELSLPAAGADVGPLREAVREAHDEREERAIEASPRLVRAAERLLPADPRPDRETLRAFEDAGRDAVYRGRPHLGVLLWMRSLRLGRWDVLEGLATSLPTDPFGEHDPPPAADLDRALGRATARVLGSGEETAQLLSAAGTVSTLLAAGVAPGPLLVVRGVARLRLGDARGALADVRAALEAPLPDGSRYGPGAPTRAVEFGRVALLVASLAHARLGAEERALEALARVERTRAATTSADQAATAVGTTLASWHAVPGLRDILRDGPFEARLPPELRRLLGQ